MPFSNKRQLYKPVLTNSDNSQSNSDNISNLTGEEIACVSLEILNQLRDYEITETFTPPLFSERGKGTQIDFQNLQSFDKPKDHSDSKGCCFKIQESYRKENTIQKMELKDGSCPVQGGYQYAPTCPNTLEEAQNLQEKYQKPITVGDIFDIPKVRSKAGHVVGINPKLYWAGVSKGCGH